MLRVERILRIKFFAGMTPGLFLGVISYLGIVLFLYYEGSRTSRDLKPCLLWQTTSVPCPLCGGTTAAISIARGDLITAFTANPLVSVGLFVAMVWALLWLVFGLRLRVAFPSHISALCLAAVALLNWAYLLFLK
tara:strand:- start:132 stop:536 length:405 start_codon:yes stop_codon:yes gene_type:complete